MTQIINLYGGPGIGKSTTAAYLYAMLKQRGRNVELVREYVKDWAWEGRKPGTYDQLYLLGKQIRSESLLYGKVDVIVTDSPVLLGVYYAEAFSPPYVAQGVREAALAFYNQAQEDGHWHDHVFLRRTKPYNPSGRFQTEEESKEIDTGVEKMFWKYIEATPGLDFHTSGTDISDLAALLDSLELARL